MDELQDGENVGFQKQAACLNCRRSKTRCMRSDGNTRCKKCSQANTECIIPEYRVGRKKGVKNKRDGLEKAVYRIEQAIKRSKSQSQSEDGRADHLKTLLSEAQGLLSGHDIAASRPSSAGPGSPVDHNRHITGASPIEKNPDEQFAVDDAENPLQLLARASDLTGPPGQCSTRFLRPLGTSSPTREREQDLNSFFGPFRPSLDIGELLDPVERGLVTMEEATILFAFFYQNLSHTRWGLDPILHNTTFVRSRSAFLFTSILAASALFIPSAGALSRRLHLHSQLLARNAMEHHNRSPEIVLAFMINVPWMAPGKHWSDDDTCSYIALALSIAMDISLNKVIVDSPSEALSSAGRTRSECITAREALDLDGFRNVIPRSIQGKRLLRCRERIWLTLFVLERGVCLARGRSFAIPVTPLIETCQSWHTSEIADIWDSSIASSAVLRRDLVDLISLVKKTCDSSHYTGSTIVQKLQEMIESFFAQWYNTWTFAIATSDGSIPPYVDILVTHGRLSIYSSVINHTTAPIEVKQFFRAAGLSSSLNVMRAAVQGESRLKSMPNNTAVMISFAACFAFRLSSMGPNNSSSLAPSVRKLIEESADVLERIGSDPPHRNGASALYGKHLRQVVASSSRRNGVHAGTTYGHPQLRNSPSLVPFSQTQSGQIEANNPNPIQAASELLQFSAMSGNQIIETITNADALYLPDFPVEDRLEPDWLDWFHVEMNS